MMSNPNANANPADKNNTNANHNNSNEPPPDLTFHKELVKLTARTFFAPPEILVLDYLIDLPFPAISNTDLKFAFDVKDRDIHRMCSRLIGRRLLRREHRQKDKSSSSKAAPAVAAAAAAASSAAAGVPAMSVGTGSGDIYVLDYKLFVDVLSFLLYELTGRVERTVSNEVEKRGYECPKCQRKYPLNDIGSRYVAVTDARGEATFMFTCEAHPDTELVEDESLLANEPPELRILNHQIRPLLDLIEMCRDVPLPEYSRDEVLAYIRQQALEIKLEKEAANAAGIKMNKEELLSVANSKLSRKGAGLYGGAVPREAIREQVVVELVDNADEEARKLKAAQQKKNQLPDWHRFSTVTGEAIVKETAEDASMDGGQSRLDDDMDLDGEEHDEYYKDYLNQTLSGLGQKRSHGSDMDSDDEDLGFEDALPPPSKKLRTDFFAIDVANMTGANGLPVQQASSNGHGTGTSEDEDEFEFVDVASSAPLSGVMVLVAGVPMPIEHIGDDERDRMTPEEYMQYYTLTSGGGGQ